MNEFPSETGDYGTELDGMVRENPTQAILLAIGAGVALALIVRGLQPRPADSRAEQLLEDLREQLSRAAAPVYRKVKGVARDGVSLAQDGAAELSKLHLDRHLNHWTSRLLRLFR